jgi:hypothetical protein
MSLQVKGRRLVLPYDIEPSKIFKDALGMMAALLKMTYPKSEFLLELIGLLSIEKPPVLPTKHKVTPEVHNFVQVSSWQHFQVKVNQSEPNGWHGGSWHRLSLPGEKGINQEQLEY